VGVLGWIGGVVAAVGGVAAYLWFFGPDESNFETSVHIDSGPETAFGMFTDFARWVEFWDISEVAPPEPPVGVGSEFTFNEKSGALVKVAVTEWEPGAVFRADLDFTEADLGQAFSMLFDQEGEGCRVTMVNHGRLGQTVYKVLMPAMKPFVKKYYSNVLGRLKAATEAPS
jgi:hypothetical protein